MKKRLICLLMALFMVSSLILTSCSSENQNDTEEGEDESARQNVILTVYGVTKDSTTDEAVAAVEKAFSEYCIAKYKTAIDLRLFKESEYESALNDVYKKFAEEDKKKAEEQAKLDEEAKAEKERVKGMTNKEKQAYVQEKRIKQREAEEQAKKEAAERKKLIEEGKDIALLKDVQMDIIYIPGYEAYLDNIEKSRLVDINTYVSGRYKDIKSFLYPAFIFGATQKNGLYGLPMNKGVAGKETYFVVDKALSEKYEVDWSKVRSITDLEPYFAAIKAGEKISPIYGDFEPENVAYLNVGGDVKSRGIASCFFTDTLLGAPFTAEMMNKTFNNKGSYGTYFIDYLALKAKYKTSGYMSNNQGKFFVSVQELDEAEKQEWLDKGYDLVLYKGAEFSTDDVFDGGLFGISSRCEYPERAMEVLKLMYTDETLHDIFAYGIKDVNYVLDTLDDGTEIVRPLDDSYAMDILKTGNTLIGHASVTDENPQRIELAKKKNVNSRLSPMLGIYFEETCADAPKAIEAYDLWNKKYEAKIEKMISGTNDYQKILDELSVLINDETNGYTYKSNIEDKVLPVINEHTKKLAEFSATFQ